MPNFSATNLVHHFLHIYHLDFCLKKICLPSKFQKILWNNIYIKELPYRNYNFWIWRWSFLLIRPRLLILTTRPSCSYTLAYCRPIHLISLEFTMVNCDLGTPPKILYFPYSCYKLAFQASLWLRILPQKIRMERDKFLQFKVEKNNLILISILHANKF
jgi:hypothetical protein